MYNYLPLLRTGPNTLWFRAVEQFQRSNWNCFWHSKMACLAPRLTHSKDSGFFWQTSWWMPAISSLLQKPLPGDEVPATADTPKCLQKITFYLFLVSFYHDSMHAAPVNAMKSIRSGSWKSQFWFQMDSNQRHKNDFKAILSNSRHKLL